MSNAAEELREGKIAAPELRRRVNVKGIPKRRIEMLGGAIKKRIEKGLAERAEEKRIFRSAFREAKITAIRQKAHIDARRSVFGSSQKRGRTGSVRFPRRFEPKPLESPMSEGFTLFPEKKMPPKPKANKKRREIIIRI